MFWMTRTVSSRIRNKDWNIFLGVAPCSTWEEGLDHAVLHGPESNVVKCIINMVMMEKVIFCPMNYCLPEYIELPNQCLSIKAL